MNTDEFYAAAERVVDCAFGGYHHVHKLAKTKECVSFNVPAQLSTWDRNELTALVVAAHDECVRAEIGTAGPRYLKIYLSPRVRKFRGAPIMWSHPTMEQAVAAVRGGRSGWSKLLDELDS